MKKEIAIYGGAFDPIHLGHVAIAKAVRDALNIPVWITPAAYHPFGKKMTSFEHRKAMIKLALADEPNIEIADHELRNYSGLTADASAILRAEHPDTKFRIIMGEDNAQIIKTKWEGYERIIEHHPLIIMERKGCSHVRDWYHEPPHISVPWNAIEVSSSKIRSLLYKEGDNRVELEKCLHPAVWGYIIDHRLYHPFYENCG